MYDIDLSICSIVFYRMNLMKARDLPPLLACFKYRHGGPAYNITADGAGCPISSASSLFSAEAQVIILVEPTIYFFEL